MKSLSNKKGINIYQDYMGKISIKPNEEYMWNYNNYFINNKFIKSYDALDWIVIGPSKFTSHSIFSRNKHKSSYELCEGDFIKFGMSYDFCWQFFLI